MLLQSILFIAGITGVYFVAEWLVKGSSNLSRDLGIRPIVIGLTVVAFGTSTPELAVSLTASIKGSDDIAIGNIIGSNIANIGLILGIAAIVLPLQVERIIMKRELPLMIAISAALFFMAIDKKIGFIDGLVLFTGIIFYISYQVYNTLNAKGRSRNSTGNADEATSLSSSAHSSHHHSGLYTPDDNAGITKPAYKQSPTGKKNLLLNIFYIMVGLVCLLIGSHILVKAAIFIAGRLGISEMVIGLTVVAFGTSIPEMATSVVSVFRKEADICVGNIIGSNIFNILMIIGSVALIRPLNVARETLFFELPVMLLFSVALIPMIRGSLRVNRLEGILLVLGYFVFIFLLFQSIHNVG
ncbi:MAG: calcium/sodium antiporter [Planctomycetota bacterium]